MLASKDASVTDMRRAASRAAFSMLLCMNIVDAKLVIPKMKSMKTGSTMTNSVAATPSVRLANA